MSQPSIAHTKDQRDQLKRRPALASLTPEQKAFQRAACKAGGVLQKWKPAKSLPEDTRVRMPTKYDHRHYNPAVYDFWYRQGWVDHGFGLMNDYWSTQ